MYSFKNSILIVVFNYSDCVCNKNAIRNIYERHFKTIIFYSDYPVIHDDKEVNFIDINKGLNAHKIFNHFYENYRSMIEECDGCFYTMDDNIINVNILNLFDSRKIMYYSANSKNDDMNKILSGVTTDKSWFKSDLAHNHSGWWWEHDGVGKNALFHLMNDREFKKYNIDKFSGAFSDWFYLTKKYLTEKIFDLFYLFSKHNVFLEIAIPSIIHYIEPDNTQYHTFKNEILWMSDRIKFSTKEWIYNSLNHYHNLILHPIKFNENPSAIEWLKDILCKEKCVIITTINKPTEAILKHINNKDYDVIIVGDHKTTDEYKKLNCIYLDIQSQKTLFPDLSELLPYNHYCRKNLGYLYAIKRGYKIIYETDDDNIPYDNFDNVLQYKNVQMITEQNNVWINIFKYFTNNAHIWPRGYPLSLLKNEPNYSIKSTDKTPSIINGLVENDPDVDALFRIICTHQNNIVWEKDKNILVDNKNVCVFNTQNTFWLNPQLFACLLIPCSVSFRYCDILRGIINNIILKNTNNYMMYSSPNVIQNRNEHNLLSDFKSEIEMYIHNETILNIIEQKKYLYIIQTASSLPEIFNCLKKRDHIILSFKEKAQDTTLFYPGSTWTTGRNKLREYILNLEKKYDYYVFLDEDVVFTHYSQEDGFNKFEELLVKYKPYIANPNIANPNLYYINHNGHLKGEAQNTVWFDGMCNAFSREAFLSNIIFPYVDLFDSRSWWMSQYVMIILCSLYQKEVLLFNDLYVSNICHSDYPKLDIFKETEQHVFDNIINISDLHLIEGVKSQSIFKIFDFLNIILNKFHKIIFIDVGCAGGDARSLLKHSNVFSIGIDPLIESYRTIGIEQEQKINCYNILHPVAIDIDEGERTSTSSFHSKNERITSDYDNNSHFNITTTKKVHTQTLKNIIEKNNLKQDIIHILKVDAQGHDLNVVKSLRDYIKNVMFIVIECNSDNTTIYENSTHYSEDNANAYFELHNFQLVTKEIFMRDDVFVCLYFNTNLIKSFDSNWDHKIFKEKSVCEDKFNVKDNLLSIYNNLLVNNIIKLQDMDVLNKWITYF